MFNEYSDKEIYMNMNIKYEHYVNHNIGMMVVDYFIPHRSSSSALDAIETKYCK